MNLRKHETVENNRKKLQIMQEYLRLSYNEQAMYSLEYAFKFGTKNPLAFYVGVPIFLENPDESALDQEIHELTQL